MGGEQPIPHPSGMTDWIGLPNQSGQGAGAAGWPRRVGSRAQLEHLRAPSQRVGWPTFLSPTPGSRPPPISGRTCVHGMESLRPCPAGWGKRGVPQGVTEFQAWGAPAQPCMALSSWSGRAVAAGPVGEVGSSATWDGEPDTSVYRRRPHPGGSQEWGECPSLSPSPQEPEPRATSVYWMGEGLAAAVEVAGPLFSRANSWRDPTLCGRVRGHQNRHHWLVSYWERGGGDITGCRGKGWALGGTSGRGSGRHLLKPGLMSDSPGHRLLTPGPGQPL